ncbi:MAG: ABC transporter substrate-binding protein [Christensenellales bacterium]
MKKYSSFFKLVSFLLVLVFALSFAGCETAKPTATTAPAAATTAPPAATTAPTAKPTGFTGEILIGGTAELTSTSAMSGTFQKQGTELAVKEINDAGGVLGKKLVLLFEDNAGTPDGALLAVGKLVSQKIVALVGPMTSAQALAVNASLLTAKQITLFGGTSAKLSYAELKNDYAFMMRPNDSLTSPNAAKFLIEQKKCTKIGIIHDNDDFGNGAAGNIAAYLDGLKFPYVNEGYNTGDKDLQAIILKFKDAGCDGIVAWGHVAELAIFNAQCYGLDFKPFVIGSATIGSKAFTDVCEAAAVQGWYSCTEFSADRTDDITKKIVEGAKKAYNIVPDHNYASYYGAVYILKDAIERAGTTETEALRKALLETKDLNIVYGYTTDSQHRMAHSNVILEVQADKTTKTVATVVGEIK